MATEEDATGDALTFLQQQPQFIALRRAVQNNPTLLPQLLQELGQANPELLQVLNSLDEILFKIFCSSCFELSLP